MDKPKDSTTSSKKNYQNEEKAYDINDKKKQEKDMDASNAPDQPLADMNE